MENVLIYDQRPGAMPPDLLEFKGEWIDCLETQFPTGFDGASITTWIRSKSVGGGFDQLEFDQYDRAITPDDEVVLTIAPAGIIIGAIAAIAAIASLVVSLTAGVGDDPSAENNAQRGIGVRTNQAELGSTIAVRYGRTVDTPPLAAARYRRFENQSETAYILLLLGAGEYEVNQIRIGDTELTPERGEFRVYKPDDHQGLANHILNDFGVHENTETSGDVADLEIRNANPVFETGRRIDQVIDNGPDRTLRSTTNWPTAAQVGDELVISSPVEVAGRYPIIGVNGDDLTIDNDTFPTTFNDRINLSIVPQASGELGPFVTNRRGTIAEKLEFDIEFPRGQARVDVEEDDEELRNQDLTTQFTFKVDTIDDDGTVLSTATTVFTRTSAQTNHQRYTLEYMPPVPGRFRVSLTARFTGGDVTGNDRTEMRWTGLRAFRSDPPDAKAWGHTTILALRLYETEGVSNRSRDRIMVDQTSVLEDLETGLRIPTGNAANVYADMIRNPHYSAGRPASFIETESVMAWHERAKALPWFNGIFNRNETLFSALSKVVGIHQGQVYQRRDPIGVVFDDLKPARSGFIHLGELERGSFIEQVELIGSQSHDGIEYAWREPFDFEERTVQFPPAEGDPLRLADPDAYPPAPTRFRRRNGIGVTDEAHALLMAEYHYFSELRRGAIMEGRVDRKGLNWRKFDRIGAVLPLFEMGRSVSVIASDGLSVTFDDTIEAGPISLCFRDQKGMPSDPQPATADGSATIVLDGPAPFAFALDGTSRPTVAFYEPVGESVADILILSNRWSGRRCAIRAVYYDPRVPTLHRLLEG